MIEPITRKFADDVAFTVITRSCHRLAEVNLSALIEAILSFCSHPDHGGW